MTNVYLMDGGAFTNALMANTLVDRMELVMKAADSDSSAQPPAKAAPPKTARLSFRPVAGIDTPRELAAAYPSAKRAEAEALFRDLLSRFGQVERQFGQPRRDLPTAVALFISTSHEAATGIEIPPSYGNSLIAQLRTALAVDPAVASASDADKQRLYEQFAIIGMMTGGTMLALKAKPDRQISDKVKATGDDYFRQVLKLDPAQVRFTDEGMQLASR
ncbi:MAG: DUF6683 family protein [Sphingorhabdus sp.]